MDDIIKFGVLVSLLLLIISLLFKRRKIESKHNLKTEDAVKFNKILSRVMESKVDFVEFTEVHTTSVGLTAANLHILYVKTIKPGDTIVYVDILWGADYDDELHLTHSENVQQLVDSNDGSAIAVSAKVGVLEAVVFEVKKRVRIALLEEK